MKLLMFLLFLLPFVLLPKGMQWDTIPLFWQSWFVLASIFVLLLGLHVAGGRR